MRKCATLLEAALEDSARRLATRSLQRPRTLASNSDDSLQRTRLSRLARHHLPIHRRLSQFHRCCLSFGRPGNSGKLLRVLSK